MVWDSLNELCRNVADTGVGQEIVFYKFRIVPVRAVSVFIHPFGTLCGKTERFANIEDGVVQAGEFVMVCSCRVFSGYTPPGGVGVVISITMTTY